MSYTWPETLTFGDSSGSELLVALEQGTHLRHSWNLSS